MRLKETNLKKLRHTRCDRCVEVKGSMKPKSSVEVKESIEVEESVETKIKFEVKESVETKMKH